MAAPEFPADRAEGKTTAPKRPLIMRYAARSDVGRIRAKNDDSAYVGRHLAVVADGMGGHAGGDVASAATVLDMIHLDHDDYDGDAGTVLADEIQTANSLLSELVHINPKLAGMGTTVTALLLAEGKLHFAHIGDSRAYRLRDGEFEQVSVDHTFVQRLIDEGRLRPEEAETHPHKNVLMRVLGDVDASPELDLDTLAVQAGERWLLCSDGLNYVAGHVVERTVRETKDLGECAELLVELTLEAGAPDNVTVVVLDIAEPTRDDVRTAAVDVVPAPAAAAGTSAPAAPAGRRWPAAPLVPRKPAGESVKKDNSAQDTGSAALAAAAGASGRRRPTLPQGPRPTARRRPPPHRRLPRARSPRPPPTRIWANTSRPKSCGKNSPCARTNLSGPPPQQRNQGPFLPSPDAPWPGARPRSSRTSPNRTARRPTTSGPPDGRAGGSRYPLPPRSSRCWPSDSGLATPGPRRATTSASTISMWPSSTASPSVSGPSSFPPSKR